MSMKKSRVSFWNGHFLAWRKSGLLQTEYCKKNKLDEQLFSKWKMRLSNKSIDPENGNFVKIPVVFGNGKNRNDTIELVFKDKYKITIYSDFNPETLKKLIIAIDGVTP